MDCELNLPNDRKGRRVTDALMRGKFASGWRVVQAGFSGFTTDRIIIRMKKGICESPRAVSKGFVPGPPGSGYKEYVPGSFSEDIALANIRESRRKKGGR